MRKRFALTASIGGMHAGANRMMLAINIAAPSRKSCTIAENPAMSMSAPAMADATRMDVRIMICDLVGLRGWGRVTQGGLRVRRGRKLHQCSSKSLGYS